MKITPTAELTRDGTPRKRTYIYGLLRDRWLARIRPQPNGCWEWAGAHSPAGYGRIYVAPKTWANAHRAGYELLVGPVPEGLVLDHLCRNRGCVNPAHVEPVTTKENIRRGDATSKGWCHRGHDITDPANRYDRKDKPGRWNCRACIQICTAERKRLLESGD